MTTLDRLRSALKALAPGAPVVLQIQRTKAALPGVYTRIGREGKWRS